MDSYFEEGAIFEGTLWVNGDVHFGASIKGDVYSNDHFIIAHSGSVKGDIHSYNLSTSGKVDGNIFSQNKTSLLKGGVLTGDISTYQLVIDEGADFGGRCKMIDAPVDEMSKRDEVEKKSEEKTPLNPESKARIRDKIKYKFRG